MKTLIAPKLMIKFNISYFDILIAVLGKKQILELLICLK